ncbi:MAG TPA: methyltransferase domain-containing protein [Candidatus Limnocylindria bacterium]|nr:methyltransferase domain-containing protein [Candidatus Limnocylindria bacterium]
MNALAEYYAQRAPEYDRIYQKPERQVDLATLREFVAQTFAERSVLEVACGTGYWTQCIAATARSVVATDINDEVLAIAHAKNLATFPSAAVMRLNCQPKEIMTPALPVFGGRI